MNKYLLVGYIYEFASGKEISIPNFVGGCLIDINSRHPDPVRAT
jgi:hypothetical protein